ncbi:unnamed protein product, partial [Meganyctiphanes norvegica]
EQTIGGMTKKKLCTNNTYGDQKVPLCTTKCDVVMVVVVVAGNVGFVWLDGKAVAGSGQMVWQRHGTELLRNNSLWRTHQPVFRDHEDRCLMMDPVQGTVKRYPTQPYFTMPCTEKEYTFLSEDGYTLCE